MQIICKSEFPSPLITAGETWKDQGCLIKLLGARPPKVRDSVYRYNDKYGFSQCLRYVAGLEEATSVYGILTHGIIPYGREDRPAIAPSQEISNKIPCILASNDRCIEAFKNAGKIDIYPIGLTSLYAMACMQREQINGRGSLFFLSHSTPAFNDEVDDAAVIRWLKQLPSRYQPIRISAFPHDLLRGKYKPYKEAGFRVVCAGNAYDPKFIWRHLHLIRSHRYIFSTGIGTHVFHATMCGKPVLIKEIEHKYTIKKRGFIAYVRAKQYFQRRIKIYAAENEEPNAEQMKLARTQLGMQHMLPPSFLRDTLNKAGKIHAASSITKEINLHKKQNKSP